MAVRVLRVIAAFAVLYGCGQASSPVEKQKIPPRRSGVFAWQKPRSWIQTRRV